MKNRYPKVLVNIVYTDYKAYCKWLYPVVYDSLDYPNKEEFFVTEENTPELADLKTGEEIAAAGRNAGIYYARKNDFDYILQLDCDVEPPKDVIQRLLAVDHPLAGGAVAARGNENEFIGHYYHTHGNHIRLAVPQKDAHGIVEVGGTASACLLIAREVFSQVDYEGYKGPNTIHDRFTADDEYYQIKVFKELEIRPKVDFNLKPWHYDANGWMYRLWGDRKYWRTQED
jgi:hypothetical protein